MLKECNKYVYIDVRYMEIDYIYLFFLKSFILMSTLKCNLL